jgi:hypothetical protein
VLLQLNHHLILLRAIEIVQVEVEESVADTMPMHRLSRRRSNPLYSGEICEVRASNVMASRERKRPEFSQSTLVAYAPGSLSRYRLSFPHKSTIEIFFARRQASREHNVTAGYLETYADRGHFSLAAPAARASSIRDAGNEMQKGRCIREILPDRLF